MRVLTPFFLPSIKLNSPWLLTFVPMITTKVIQPAPLFRQLDRPFWIHGSQPFLPGVPAILRHVSYRLPALSASDPSPGTPLRLSLLSRSGRRALALNLRSKPRNVRSILRNGRSVVLNVRSKVWNERIIRLPYYFKKV